MKRCAQKNIGNARPYRNEIMSLLLLRLILLLIITCSFLLGISRLFYVQCRLFKKTRLSPKFASAANILFWDADVGVKLSL
jgi:hypothetical protein